MSLKSIATALALIVPALSLSASLAEAGWRNNTINQKADTAVTSKMGALKRANLVKVCVEWGPKQNPNDFAGPCVRWEYREPHDATTH
jgi:hypothetical protein